MSKLGVRTRLCKVRIFGVGVIRGYVFVFFIRGVRERLSLWIG